MMLKNDRGVALIIVLLVTALLIALVFEFAYSTRVSMRAAQNFRDSERAYFLARSAVNYYKKFKTDLGPQGELPEVPFISIGDTVVRLVWEDESGKINLHNLVKTDSGDSPYSWLAELFSQKGISQSVLDRITDSSNPKLQMLSDLHRYMSDEDYYKVAPFLTVNQVSGNTVNASTASETVLRCVLHNKPSAVNDLLYKKQTGNLKTDDVKGLAGITLESKGSKVSVYATAGGYTKIIEIIPDSEYWKSL